MTACAQMAATNFFLLTWKTTHRMMGSRWSMARWLGGSIMQKSRKGRGVTHLALATHGCYSPAQAAARSRSSGKNDGSPEPRAVPLANPPARLWPFSVGLRRRVALRRSVRDPSMLVKLALRMTREGRPAKKASGSAAHTATLFVSSSQWTSLFVILSASFTSIEGSRTFRRSAAHHLPIDIRRRTSQLFACRSRKTTLRKCSARRLLPLRTRYQNGQSRAQDDRAKRRTIGHWSLVIAHHPSPPPDFTSVSHNSRSPSTCRPGIC